MDFKSMIRQLRNNANISQQDIADKVGIARATYAGLESGRREPNLAEIRSIAEFYQIAPSDIINGIISTVSKPATPYIFDKKAADIVPREIDHKVNPEKLREVLLYILDKVGAKPNVGETVLYKLLYFIDFDYYEKYGQSITGLTYVRNHFGPTPTASFSSVVEGMKKNKELEIVTTKFFNNLQRKYLPTVSTDLHELRAKELRHIDEEISRLGDKNATELSDLSHKDTPWLASKHGEVIDYQLAMYRTDATSVREYEDEL
ncbi:XRE family transcriptional regulator [Candidatus Saccharibacteria bacterium CG11_big_fil_rev_8_21_14_0_20_41_19]|nr:MAG: XRE family transcriptional regulator [Candidatus Saccharibacteria bacterium CG11_big_fil_rev_8_21_14_0_20_41_19]PIZ60214.1 MAG: XRE family transcriptional regulator [Candidatus Saccharibacteria bacterium CG_4_10_14_0_2_um_filter_41_11]PJC29344.1 MAG: XRE family transcriptional regulator [Candidatus Saccharibacteria bacterium CG_4_9_14_0_2_um_filter_41_9]